MSTFQKNIRDYHMTMLTVTLCIYKISVFKEYLLLSASDSQLTQTNIQVQYCQFYCNARFLVFNPTFRNISAISWRPVLVVEEVGVPEENHRPWATGKLYHLRLRVECILFCNLQSRAQTHAVLVIGLYEILGNPTT
jgi:hypothetical protein